MILISLTATFINKPQMLSGVIFWSKTLTEQIFSTGHGNKNIL